MPIYEFSQTGIAALPETAFSAVNVWRDEIRQRLLRDNVGGRSIGIQQCRGHKIGLATLLRQDQDC